MTTTMSQRILKCITPLESYFVSIQSILIWENPILSAFALVAFNCLYWLVVSWHRRIYSIISLIAFVVTLHKFWRNHIWPEIRLPPSPDEDTEGWTTVHPKILSAPEISHYINKLLVMTNGILEWFTDLRANSPGSFCLILTSALTICAFIGGVIPGVVIVYAIMMTIALGPGLGLYLIPPSWFQKVNSIFTSDKSDKLEKEPSVTETELEFNEKALDETVASLSSDSAAATSEDNGYREKALDRELGIKEGTPDEDSQKRLSRGSSENNGINFVLTYFNGSSKSQRSSVSSAEDIDEDYEIVTEADILQDTESLGNKSS